MAKHYSKNNALKDEYLTAQRKTTLGAKICGICFILWAANIFIFHISHPLFLFPCFMGFAGGGVYAALHSQKIDKLKAGVDGEDATVDFLTSLPDDYSIVSNAIVRLEGRQGELDNIVIGPNGVFVIETKNRNGEISGSYNDKNLTQYKIGRGGTPYTNEFYNPIKQVATHVYLLSNLLKQSGINTWVQGIVYFSNPDAEVNVEFEYNKTPVFSYSDNGESEMYTYITEHKAERPISEEQIAKIIGILLADN